MFLERLELWDFRNYETLTLEFDKPLTIFRGRNAQGKTNLLEAVALLALARSPRASRDGEMVRYHQAQALVRGEVRRSQRPSVALSLTLRRDGSKTYRVDGQDQARLLDGIGQVAVVFFGPGELRLVSGSPGGRRDYLNTCLGQVSPAYLAAMAGYRGALRARNAVLRDAGRGARLDLDLLATLDEQFVAYGAGLMAQRAAWVAQLAQAASEVHDRLSAGRERLAVAYSPHQRLPGPPEEWPAALGERLTARRDDELRRGVTLLGPHRDDLRLTIDGVEARLFASQGQQRTAALALKLAELRLITEALGEPPLLLLDDVLSELDSGRRAATAELAEQTEQVLLTGAEGQGWDLPALGAADLRWVEEGTVRAE